MVKVGVEAAGPPPPGLLHKELFGTPEQRVFLAHARAFVRFSATQRASLIGMQEWKARPGRCARDRARRICARPASAPGVLDAVKIKTMPDRRVFISYSHHDRAIARMIDATLRVAGVTTFLDERDIKVGDLITESIYAGISSSTDLLYILSEHSVASKWTVEELGIAKIRQKQEEGFGILPVIIDGVTPPVSLINVRWADMRNWQDANQYRIAVLELLRALDISPHLISYQQLQWWIRNRLELVAPKESVAECYHVADIMVGYYHEFQYEMGKTGNPYRWAWNWILKETDIYSHLRKLRNTIEPALLLDRRYKIIYESADSLREVLMNRRGNDEKEMRSVREHSGRIISVFSDLEAEALAVTLSIADIEE